MAQHDLSPEEKLLRLIKSADMKKSKSGQKQDSLNEASDTSSKKPEDKITVIKTTPKIKREIQIPVFKIVHYLLWIVFLAPSIYLVSDFLFNKANLERTVSNTTKQLEPEESKEDKEKATLEPYSYYANQIAKRDLFSSSVAIPPTQGPSTVILGQAIQDLNLIGIISGDNPQAIIEDRKNQKTYFLNKGDFLGDFQVDQILKGKVILNWKGEKFELSL